MTNSTAPAPRPPAYSPQAANYARQYGLDPYRVQDLIDRDVIRVELHEH